MAEESQFDRLEALGIQLDPKEKLAYTKGPDVLGKVSSVPIGYKRCTKCGVVKKMYLFNKNSQTKDLCTCHCKECQAKKARESYARNKHKRNYKKYYQANKEAKQAQSRLYYQTHKEEMRIKHAQYRSTPKGRKAMNRAHAKRAMLLKRNTGIPYTRELIIERDKQGGTEPICYLCGKPITGPIHLDHVIPVVMHGKDCFTNVACVHDICNLSKSKDGRELTTEQVEHVIKLSETYMENHQDQFPDVFGVDLPSEEGED